MAGTKAIRVILTEDEHADLIEEKDGRTWKEVLQDGAKQ